MSRPSRAIVVTGLPLLRPLVKATMTNLWRSIRRRKIKGEAAWHIEPNPRNNGAHAHVWWRGDHLDRDLMTEIAQHHGAGLALEQPARLQSNNYAIPTLDYGLKSILRARPVHAVEMWPEAEEYLRLNGGLLVGTTKCYWRDWNDNPIAGVRRARTAAHRWPHSRAVSQHGSESRNHSLQGHGLPRSAHESQ
ncbi:MAG: hypothetical protein QM572_15715 [Nocardioides sp.]|uniref:hypothetical protein n=1 Tax=Nocardioides sp. TaxID=35761 RepID=UPI0039E25E67